MNFVGAIVPEVCQHCACGWGGFFALVQNILKLGIVFAIFLAVLMFAYAGFLWVTNPASPSNKEKGREVLMQTIIGLVVVLGAWLIVNTVLVALSTGGVTSWTSIFSTVQPSCLTFSPAPTASTSNGGGTLTPTSPTTGGGSFTYDSGVQSQASAESGALSTLLSCMEGKVPAGVGRISAITDSYTGTDVTKITQCANTGGGSCKHTVHSCHYGGRTCVGQAYAVDFGDGDPQHPTNLAALKSAATSCNAAWMTDNEGGVQTHLHVSVGSCGCDGH